MNRIDSIALLGVTALLMAGCGKKADDAATTTTEPAAASSQSPTPAPSAAPPAESAAPAGEIPDIDSSGAPAEAMGARSQNDESAIVNDPRAQWAVRAEASSTYRDPAASEPYSAWQATGAPNVGRYSDNALAWASKSSDGGIEWLQVEFDKPVHASAVRVRQNHAPGAITKLELIDVSGARHIVWEGIDDSREVRDRIVWFKRQFERTPYLVKGARVELASNEVWGWNEIDAVQLVTAEEPSGEKVTDGAAVRVESEYLEGGWLMGRIGPSPSGCRMVFLDKASEGGYTSIALTTLKRIERSEGGAWRAVPVQPLLAQEPTHCTQAGAD